MNRVAALAMMLIAMMLIGAGSVLSGDGDELKRMAGSWSGEIVEAAGKPATDDFKAVKLKLVMKGDVYTVYFDDKQVATGTVKLDPTKKPKTIDAAQTEGPYKDKIQPGIYEFKGEDLHVVFGAPGQERPKEFKTRDGTKDALIVYKRLKEAKK